MTSEFPMEDGRPASAGRGEIDWQSLESVHLTAVAGVGMTALAGLLQARGLKVRGSDEQVYPPMSDVLAELGIEVLEGYAAANLEPPPDLVIVGNKISRGNEEGEALLASQIPYRSMPSALGELFLADKRSLVVAGTHGKSTSTAMLATVLRSAGRDPSMMVGGHALDFGGNFALGKGPHFVIEGDEYDSAFFDKRPKFVHYSPDAAILTAVEFDHADIYQDIDAIKKSFRKLVELLPSGAPLAVNISFSHAAEIAAEASHCAVESFGTEDARWSFADLRDDGERTRFAVRRDGSAEGEVALRAPGYINVWNALGVYVLARAEGLTHDEVATGLEEFRGVARRQELVGVYGAITLIDDFAHHPTAVRGVLSALRQRYPDQRLWGLFEPRSNTSRRAVFQDQYVEALAAADRVVLADVFRKQSDALARENELSTDRLTEDLRARGCDARVEADAEGIAQVVLSDVRAGDVVVMMSNGAFGGLRRLLADGLSQRP